MLIGVPREIKVQEYRVGLTPASVREVVARPRGAGRGGRGQVLFTYLHLAPDPDQARDLVASGAACIAYETIAGPGGGLPLLAPMSEVAGRMAVQAGAHCLEKTQGGMGILLTARCWCRAPRRLSW